METLTLTTPELRKGDTVLCHGLRCLLDTEPQLSTSHPLPSVYYVPALVLNRDDVSDRAVPHSFTRVYDAPSGRPTGEHRWTIQGNQYAYWAVERSA